MSPAEYRRALDVIMRGLVRVLIPILRLLFRAGIENPSIRARRIDRLTPVVLSQMRATRRLVWNLTSRFLRSQAALQNGVPNAYVPALPGYSSQAVRTTLERIAESFAENPVRRDEAVDRATSTFVRHAEQAGRQTIADAVEPDPEEGTELPGDQIERGLVEEPGQRFPVMRPVDPSLPEKPVVPPIEFEPRDTANDQRRPVAWARVLTGADDCAFCVMLASRGPVYGSRARALFANDNPLERYHDNCDCIAVPIYTSKNWPGKAEAEALERLWREATQGFTQGDAINALRRELYRKKKAGEELFPGRRPLREVA